MGDTERQDDSVQRPSRVPHSVATLHLIHPPAAARAVVVPPRGLTLGRVGTPAQADVAIADPLISRLHARIAREGAAWELRDLGSRNGAFVNGTPLAPGRAVAIDDGAVVRVGDTLAVFTVATPEDGPEAPEAAYPGVSALAAQVRRRIHRLACAPGHVLVLGETGTGKEGVAREIGGTTRVFVPQNCAELSRELARSELFGHTRGAFSGATAARAGLVEIAHDGALFLDEVGELALDVQAELLRFLEDGHYRAVGATELRYSSARVIAATNVDLDEAVRAGTFRRDLLARLRASNRPLELPPLRERRADLLDWSLRFLREALGREPPEAPWTVGALECLLLYPWPENLRELRGVVRGVAEVRPSWPVAPSALPHRIREHRRVLREQSEGDDVGAAERTAAPTREQIEAALTRAGGRVRAAAAELQIDRTRLYRLCEKLSIDVEAFRTGG